MFEDVSSDTPDADVGPYVEAVRSAVTAVGRDRILAETELEESLVDAMSSGDDETVGAIHLTEIARILTLENGRDPAAELRATREELLLAMSSEVTDVEALTAGLDTDLDPKEVQAKLEGRFPMTLREYALLRAALDP